MAKQTQTIRRLQLTNCLSVLDHFVGLALYRLIGSLVLLANLSNQLGVWYENKIVKMSILILRQFL